MYIYLLIMLYYHWPVIFEFGLSLSISEIRLVSYSLNITVLYISKTAPNSEAHKSTDGLHRELILYMRKYKVALAKDMLDVN